MNVAQLRDRLSALPDDMEVEVEVHDVLDGRRLYGKLLLADEEGGELNLFAQHEETPE